MCPDESVTVTVAIVVGEGDDDGDEEDVGDEEDAGEVVTDV